MEFVMEMAGAEQIEELVEIMEDAQGNLLYQALIQPYNDYVSH